MWAFILLLLPVQSQNFCSCFLGCNKSCKPSIKCQWNFHSFGQELQKSYFHITLFLLHNITVLLAKCNRLLNLWVLVLVDSKKGFWYKQLILFCKRASKQMLTSKERPFWIFLPILQWKTKNVSLTLNEPAEASRWFYKCETRMNTGYALNLYTAVCLNELHCQIMHYNSPLVTWNYNKRTWIC